MQICMILVCSAYGWIKGSQSGTDGSPNVIAMSIVIVMIEGAAAVSYVKSVSHLSTIR